MDSKTNQRAKAPKAWIREGTDEEPVDFLDPKVVQRVVGKSCPLLLFYSCMQNKPAFGWKRD